jgi:hypothetical protein
MLSTILAVYIAMLTSDLGSDGWDYARKNFKPGVSLGVLGPIDDLKPAASVDITEHALIFWLSVGTRFSTSMVNPYAEAGLYLGVNAGAGVSYVHGHGAVPHYFFGIPVPISRDVWFRFVEPYTRFSMIDPKIYEFGLLIKFGFVRHAEASCPHVYSFDGQENRLDADMLSGSFSKYAESEDIDRLEYLVADKGRYHLRIANDREERDYINQVQLLAVDHDPENTVLPSPRGDLVKLGPLVAPLAATDNRGHDERGAVLAEDSRNWRGQPLAHDPDKEDKPEDTLEIIFPRPHGAGEPYLVLRLRNTDEATKALYQYLGRIGPGIATLLRLEENNQKYPIKQRMSDELERLGVPLHVQVHTTQGWRPLDSLRPVGPAASRYQAIPLPSSDGETVRVRLTGSPGAWEIDRVAIANGVHADATTLALTRAAGIAGLDIADTVSATDEDRLLLHTGEGIDLDFAAPDPTPGKARSLFLRLNGYYEVDVGGGYWLNPLALYRHNAGTDSAPRFFLRSLRAH